MPNKIVKSPRPLISVIVVNHNGKKWLKRCLDSLFTQDYPKIEIVLVDNSSIDGSVDFVERHYPWVKIVKSDINLGFAAGNNLGIGAARGDYILLLNNDTWFLPNFVSKLLDDYFIHKVDVIGPVEGYYDGYQRLTNTVTKIDFFGHPTMVYSTGSDQGFYLSGVCLLFSRKTYQQTFGLDNDFFMYVEEVDWFWRLHLLKKTFYLDRSVIVYHAGMGSSSAKINRHRFLWRNENTLQMLLKNYSVANLFWVVPVYLLQNVAEIIVFLMMLRPDIALTYFQGWVFNIKNLHRILVKRRKIQSKRLVGDTYIIKKMYHGFGKLKHLKNRSVINGA